MPSAIELFSGCGGLSTGLIAAGFEVLSAVEINQTAADTYGLNHPTVNLIVDVFAGNFGEKSLQIGNAVPVRLAQVMGARLIQCLNEINGQV